MGGNLMENFIKELESKKILSKDDIIILKKYIATKYADHSPAQKLHVLTTSINQVLDKNIEGIKKEYAETIRQSLLKTTLLKDGRTIFLIDIFNTSISFQDGTYDFSESILNWINSHVANKASAEDLKKFNLKFEEKRDIQDEAIEVIKSDATTSIENTKPNELKETLEIESTNGLEKTKHIVTSKKVKCAACALLVASFLFQYKYVLSKNLPHKNVYTSNASSAKPIVKNEEKIASNKVASSNLPQYFKYKKINQDKLKGYLANKNSLLIKEPYFSTLINVAKEFDLNPLVLFAITGQEQSFVPVNTSSANKIVNNPFNVFHSWQEYNTNLKDAAEIASRTVINLCKDRPNDKEAFHWINRKYAEDPHWGDGVEKIYNELEEAVK